MGGGYLSLIYKLYKIKKEYFKERKLYKQTIKIFPNLIYPDIKTLNDYNDSIRIKFHLSYMLGETLIKANKNKFKGGYLTLFKDIKQTHKDYNKTKTLLSDFNIISPVMYNTIADNKKIFIKNFNKIDNILKTHKDYQAIIDNIFHNFDYVLKHLDLIQEWLLSDDFNEKYKKENHPYPSLLDPKKLNDENEEINYNNIPAELAWEMNLPLPDRYKFVYWCSHGTGGTAFLYFLKLLNIGCVGTPVDEVNIVYVFKNIYNYALSNNFDFKCIALRNYHDNEKFYFLLPAVLGVHITRDPIGMLKHFLSILRPYRKAKRYIKLNDDFDKIISSLVTIGGWNMDINFYDLIEFYLNKRLLTFHDFQLEKALVNTNKHFVIDMMDIVGKKTFSTLKSMCNFLSIDIQKEMDILKFDKKMMNDNFSLLPLTLNINKDVDLFIIDENWISIVNSKIVLWNYWATPWEKAPKDYCVNITNQLFLEHEKNILQGIAFYIEEKSYNVFINNKELVKVVKYQIYKLVCRINKQKQILKNRKIKEKDLIDFMKENKHLRIKCKKIFDIHLQFIKQKYPKYIQKWKYYQEFENLCKND